MSDHVGLNDEVDPRVATGVLTTRANVRPRVGWAEAAAAAPAEALLDAPSATRFDDESWEW